MLRRQLFTGVLMVLAMTVLTGLMYPFVVVGVSQAAFKTKADGSLLTVGGKDVGSSLLGQTFTGEKYFHPRPSAAGADGYDGLASAPSNLGPSNEELVADVARRVGEYRATNGLAADALVPVDAVTASASGLDPQISVANARLQAPRVARARSVSVEQVLAAVEAHTAARPLGVLGEPGVNVLELNLDLDGMLTSATGPPPR
jgi:K+-transporting ATPase ATPase C chain